MKCSSRPVGGHDWESAERAAAVDRAATATARAKAAVGETR